MQKTLADDSRALAVYAWFRGLGDTSPGASVRAPCCGRRTSADAVVDMRAVRGTVVRPGGRGPPIDADWLCDACRSRLVRDPGNAWTRSKFARATGAPWSDIRVLRAREILDDDIRATDIPMDPHQRGEEILKNLPARNVEGTEQP